ncbi:16S rRNA (cytidine(1402)-2'-O)-methyltransferase [Candidatus Uhrbacteria bacterium]|jgi:16S rRNA (cytidine1402-2'-O)-methyltransferase|nr:16S rRNA (cytidine(1402)-2'-O)-methyltransferase [Candidatus Uhrbacteria bacterium]
MRKDQENSSGVLYVVATPIGNLSDVSKRALTTLAEVDLIAAEDTRVTRKLLTAFSIETPTTSLHQHTSNAKERTLVKDLVAGKSIAVVSDAGTPGISDPGQHFISMAINAGIEIIPIPGASAVIAALSASGFPSNRYTFVGFPPAKKGRAKFFTEINELSHAVVLYESKHRILKTLDALPQDRTAMIGRELTKMHETIYRGTIAELKEQIAEKLKGEFVIVLAPDNFKLLK